MSTTFSRHGLSLSELVDKAVPATPTMPLMHAAAGPKLFEIVDEGKVRKSPSGAYSDPLVYLFYGRPAYRPDIESLSTSESAFRPVCFLLKPEAATQIQRVLPLDSGAFHRGYFREHCPDDIKLSSFELDGKIDSAAKIVSVFFGSNVSYYFGKANKNISLLATMLVASIYKGIISNTG